MKTRKSEKNNIGAGHGGASTITQRIGNLIAVTDSRRSASAQLQRQTLPDQRPQFVQLKRHLESLNQNQNGTMQRVEVEEPLQRKFDAVQRVEEEDLLQGKFESAQRVEEEDPLQGKFSGIASVQCKDETLSQVNNTGLPNQLKAGIESLSGLSMDHVKVNYNSDRPAQLNAHAFAQGSEIHIAPGQEQHLPHEAWHVVQQAQGRVKPTMQMKGGVPVNDDVGLETEADVMGAKANALGGIAQRVSLRSYGLSLQNHANSVQRVVHYYHGVTQFTDGEATAWNLLVGRVAGLAGAEAFVEQVEADIYAHPQVVTLTNSMAGLRAAARNDINARARDVHDADALDWGEFHPMLVDMARQYGVVTGPVNTGGHSANTYTYTAAGSSQGIAEETSAHGKTAGNLNTRRAQMRVAIGLFNAAVALNAAQF